jgi:hypothetical protein
VANPLSTDLLSLKKQKASKVLQQIVEADKEAAAKAATLLKMIELALQKGASVDKNPKSHYRGGNQNGTSSSSW